MTNTNMFKEVYAISLAAKERRREALSREVERVGLHIDHWTTAMDGKKKGVQELLRHLGIIDPDAFQFFTPGHLGCLFSHYRIWEQIYLNHVNTGAEDAWYLILEDDARFHPSVTPEKLQTVWASVPADARLVKFHSSNGFSGKANLYSTESSSPYFLKQTHITFSLMAYAVHSSILRSLLLTRWTYHIDLFQTEGIYIAKKMDDSELYTSDLYGSRFYSQGLCIPNNSEDSDTVEVARQTLESSRAEVRLLFPSAAHMKEGDTSVHLYDDITERSVCNIYYSFTLKSHIGVER